MLSFYSEDAIEEIVQASSRQVDLKKIEPPRQYKETLLASELRYLVWKGGRGSAKTMTAINYAIDETFNDDNHRGSILFVRELSVALEDTQEQVEDLIEQRGLSRHFTCKKRRIKNKKTGVKMIFRGCRATSGKSMMQQLNKLKSISNVFLVIGDEAQDFTSNVLDVLLPTINRKSKLIDDGRPEKPTRWIFCLNPQKAVDPVIAKVSTQKHHKIIHVNITDLDPQFQDSELMEQMESERNEYYFPHVWMGEPFHGFSGAPFTHIKIAELGRDTQAYGSFIDPSFAGGDYTAISFINSIDGRLVMWGYAFKEGWMRCREKLANLLFKYQPTERYYESNAIADAPQEVFADDFGIEINPHFSLGTKENRIYRGASQIPDSAVFLSDHCNQEWLKLVTEYTNEALNDDPPDSLVSCLMTSGVISSRDFGKRRKRRR